MIDQSQAEPITNWEEGVRILEYDHTWKTPISGLCMNHIKVNRHVVEYTFGAKCLFSENDLNYVPLPALGYFFEWHLVEWHLIKWSKELADNWLRNLPKVDFFLHHPVYWLIQSQSFGLLLTRKLVFSQLLLTQLVCWPHLPDQRSATHSTKPFSMYWLAAPL